MAYGNMLKSFKECKYVLHPFFASYKQKIIENLISTDYCIYNIYIYNKHALDLLLEHFGKDQSMIHKFVYYDDNRIINTIVKKIKEHSLQVTPVIKWQLFLQYNKNPKLFNLFMAYKKTNLLTYIYYLHNKKEIYYSLCANPNAIDYIRNKWDYLVRKDYINYYILFNNPNAFELIREKWDWIVARQNIIVTVRDNYTEVNVLITLCCNPNAIPLIIEKWDYISTLLIRHNIPSLCNNPNAIDLIRGKWDWFVEHNLISGYCLCANPNAINLIREKWDHLRIDIFKGLYSLCNNPNAIDLINEKWDYLVEHNLINWYGLCNNPNAIDLIIKHWKLILNKTNITTIFIRLVRNPALFIDEYESIARNYFKEYIWPELTARLFHPSNINQFQNWGYSTDYLP